MAADPLHRSYRRLLFAYPGWHRRERGLEMLTTLMDAAEPGRRRPAPADALDLLVGGVRSRLRPPRGFRCVAVAVIAALFGALAFSTIAARVSASALARTPTEAEAAAVAQTALGRPVRNVPGPVEVCPYYCFHDWVEGGDEVVVFDVPFDENSGVDQATVVAWVSFGQLDAVVAEARTRLGEAGWQVGDLTAQGNGTSYFSASRAGLSIDMIATREVIIPSVSIQVEPQLPATVPLAAVAGLLVGALVGWLLAVWVMQRHRRQGRAVRALSFGWGLWTLIVMGGLVAQTAMLIGYVLVEGRLSGTSVALLPAYGLSGMLFAPLLVGVVVGTVLVSLALAALPTRALPPELAPAMSAGT